MQNTDLTEKSGTIWNIKFIMTLKMGKMCLAFGVVEIE